MPILVELAKPLRKRLKDAGYAAVVVVSQEGEKPPHRLQAAENVPALLPALQCGSFMPLEIGELMWTPGLNAARTICVNAEARLVLSQLAPHWFGAELPEIQAALNLAAARIRCPTWSHETMISQLRISEMQEADCFVEGCARRLAMPQGSNTKTLSGLRAHGSAINRRYRSLG